MNVLGSTEMYVTSRHSEHPRRLGSVATPLWATRLSRLCHYEQTTLLCELTCACVKLRNNQVNRSLSESCIYYYALQVLTSSTVLFKKKRTQRFGGTGFVAETSHFSIIRRWAKCINLLILNVVHRHPNLSEFIFLYLIRVRFLSIPIFCMTKYLC